jgi:hypothetical protein
MIHDRDATVVVVSGMIPDVAKRANHLIKVIEGLPHLDFDPSMYKRAKYVIISSCGLMLTAYSIRLLQPVLLNFEYSPLL